MLWPRLPNSFPVRVLMKILSSLALVLLASFAARADVVLEQKAEGPMLNAKMIMKIKGDRARTDTIAEGNNFTILMDLKAEKMMVLMHEQKVAMEKDMRSIREQTDAAQRAAHHEEREQEEHALHAERVPSLR